MRTIEEIRGNCRIHEDEHGKEHLVWAGARDPKDGQCIVRAPDYGRDPTGVKTWPMSVRRAVYNITHKRSPRSGLQLFQTCTVDGCVSCSRVATKANGGRFLSRRTKGLPIFTEANLRAWDKRGRKVSDEVVAQIVASPKSSTEVASEFGIDHSTVCKYRNGQLRRRAVTAALGPWGGLLA
jgi:hypothetical protein